MIFCNGLGLLSAKRRTGVDRGKHRIVRIDYGGDPVTICYFNHYLSSINLHITKIFADSEKQNLKGPFWKNPFEDLPPGHYEVLGATVHADPVEHLLISRFTGSASLITQQP